MEIPTSLHRRKLRRNKDVSKYPFPSQLKPFNDSLLLSLKSMIDKFPRTDTMTCYSYCFCLPSRLFEKDGYEKVSVPTIIAAADPSVSEIARVTVAPIAFGVVLMSIITPILTEKYARKRKM